MISTLLTGAFGPGTSSAGRVRAPGSCDRELGTPQRHAWAANRYPFCLDGDAIAPPAPPLATAPPWWAVRPPGVVCPLPAGILDHQVAQQPVAQQILAGQVRWHHGEPEDHPAQVRRLARAHRASLQLVPSDTSPESLTDCARTRSDRYGPKALMSWPSCPRGHGATTRRMRPFPGADPHGAVRSDRSPHGGPAALGTARDRDGDPGRRAGAVVRRPVGRRR